MTNTTSLRELREQVDLAISANYPGTTATKKFLDDVMMYVAQHTAEVDREARLTDNHDWDTETFDPIIACRRCATTFQTRGNKPCKGKMAKIGLRQLNSKDNLNSKGGN